MAGISAQFGIVDESTYGTPLAVARFYELVSESIKGQYERIEATGIRSGSRFLRSDRFAVNPKGAAGSVNLEVLTKGFGIWLKHMMGTISSGSANPDGFTTHTATVGSLRGKSFTAQVGRPQDDDTVQPFTYPGGKVTGWELTNDVDGILKLNLDMDFQAENLPGTAGTPNALQTVSYPVGSEIFTYRGASLTVAGVEVPVTNISIKGDSGLKADRYFIRSTGLQKEPADDSLRSVSWSATVDFDSLTQINRVASATAAGALAQIIVTWVGPTVTGASRPTLTATIPAGRFDSELPNVDGAKILTHTLGGKALDNGSASPLTLAYQSTDATP